MIAVLSNSRPKSDDSKRSGRMLAADQVRSFGPPTIRLLLTHKWDRKSAALDVRLPVKCCHSLTIPSPYGKKTHSMLVKKYAVGGTDMATSYRVCSRSNRLL